MKKRFSFYFVMDLRMDIQYIWITSWLLIYLRLVSSIPTYEDACGGTIILDSGNLAASLTIRPGTLNTTYECSIQVQSDHEYRIAYLLEHIYYNAHDKCDFNVTFDDHVETQEFCFEFDQRKFDRLAASNRLNIFIQGNVVRFPEFKILLVAVQRPFDENKCNYDEYYCTKLLDSDDIPSVCVDYSLVCHQTLAFCQPVSSDACSDIKSSPTASSNYIYIMVAVSATFLICLIVGGVIFRRCTSHHSRGESQNTRSRAMALFTVQLATRGVDSTDGNTNRAYVDEHGNPIDFSKFDPPPEYGSLEHIDVVATDSDKPVDEEDPPCYQYVMDNSNQYKVTTVL